MVPAMLANVQLCARQIAASNHEKFRPDSDDVPWVRRVTPAGFA
jgi:hypothetical protein